MPRFGVAGHLPGTMRLGGPVGNGAASAWPRLISRSSAAAWPIWSGPRPPRWDTYQLR